MHRVVPGPVADHIRSLPRHQLGRVLCSALSMCVSIAAGIYYLGLLAPAFANDLWWPEYNTTGYEAFLIDAANTLLAPTSVESTIFDLLSPRAMQRRDYSASPTRVSMHATYTRYLLLTNLTSLTYAVTNLRTLPASDALWVGAQYCYVDFERVFEIAHTAKRQARCALRYRHNSAVYLESVLRNIPWDAFLAVYGGVGGMFTVGLQNGLEATAFGQAWLRNTANAWHRTSVADEVALWAANNLTTFTMMWQNAAETGLQEVVALQNALGLTFDVVVKDSPFQRTGWTSLYAYWFFYNDLYFMQLCNQSLIATSPNDFRLGQPTSTGDLEGFLGLTNDDNVFVNQTDLVRRRIGPFLSIDLYFLAVPPSLWRAVELFQLNLARTVLDSPWPPSLVVDPVPPAWTLDPRLVYYGGNPFCLHGAPRQIVQAMFSYYDVCDAQPPLQLELSWDATLLSLLATPDAIQRTHAICALQTRAPACSAQLDAAAIELAHWRHDSLVAALAQAATDVRATGLSIMQFASNGSEWRLLDAPLVDPASLHTFFGWIYLYEWALGDREAVVFDGDEGALALVSARYTPYTMADSARVLTRASRFVLYIVYYASAVIVVVALLVLLHISKSVVSANLLAFHRLVGAVWLGRPIMALRGSTALILLSSAEIVLGRGQMTSMLTWRRRPVLSTIVLTTEATWLTVALGDLTLVLTRDPIVVGPTASLVVWLCHFAITLVWPVDLTGILDRNCSATQMDHLLHCRSAVVAVGSTSRLWLLVSVQLGIGLVLLPLVAWYRRKQHHTPNEKYVALSAAANALLQPVQPPTGFDRVACVLAGSIPIRSLGVVFHIPLWSTRPFEATAHCLHLPLPTLHAVPAETASELPVVVHRPFLKQVLAHVGVLYMLVSIGGSVSYLQVSAGHLTNDVFWPDFNMSTMHVFLASTFVHLRLLGAADVNSLTTSNTNVLASTTTTSIKTPANLAATQQLAMASDIASVVSSLRSADACSVPWIATAYCFLDVERRWELAFSSARQARCHRRATLSNGAVFLELHLRNLEASAWLACGNGAFDSTHKALDASLDGRAFLARSLYAPLLQLPDEVGFWTTHNVFRYVSMWQNYKILGLQLHYDISNAYGALFHFTISSTSGRFRLAAQTSYKMYWPLAALYGSGNTSERYVNGTSLLRGLPHYLLEAINAESLLMRNGTLPSPLGVGLAATRQRLGPFGTIDMTYVPAPEALVDVVRAFSSAVTVGRVASLEAGTAYVTLGTSVNFNYLVVPEAWLQLDFIALGGSPLCDISLVSAGAKISTGLLTLFLSDGICAPSPLQSTLYPTPEAFIFATMLTSANWTRLCAQEVSGASACHAGLVAATAFLEAAPLPPTPVLTSLVVDLRHMNISLFQLGTLNVSVVDVRVFEYPLRFDDDDPFTFFAWWFLFDWVLGRREVVLFEGDNGIMTLLSDLIQYLENTVDRSELPTTFAAYATAGVQYVTTVTLALATVTGVYVLLGCGCIEGRNLWSLHSVGSVTWVGRPLLLLRSLTAISILSTAMLRLERGQNDNFLMLRTQTNPWYTTLLAASEVTWLSAVSIDIWIIATRELTPSFTLLNTTLVWVVASLLSVVWPPAHAVTVTPPSDCRLIQVDFQFTCLAASVTIGHASRTLLLGLLVLGAHGLCYLCARQLKGAARHSRVLSYWLSSGATYLFAHDAWRYRHLVYLDRASAVYSGLLSVRRGRVMYVFDVKTWRTFAISLLPEADTPLHLRHAIPLTD
ncbi:hypothetical protein SDRG_12355 [Saprolegnia diclina VS20]|uniref:Uncharacterized protein n=1 Tax=Saprolegnia diclina (strain VS20) TaxID=1156394 RepID=T0PWA1_SAPDV|nr:hypothetical protein SDRG_12355 [Saprolegnia diclina VS20]EQC29809.1 hypothetical protein SDRG_12355 [Saprolegnia diclina VS20]|eukprot:XP_008616648.1 hypothetical protein SDRG_12355 [Saprolegnia diclina VS20]